MMKTEIKAVHLFVGVTSSILLILYLFVVLKHLDILFTSKKSKGTVQNMFQSGNTFLLNISFYNENKNKFDTASCPIKVSDVKKNYITINKDYEITYSNFFNQLRVSGIEVPEKGILFFDLLVVVLLCFGIKVGFSPKRSD